jgi:hypothetical protein
MKESRILKSDQQQVAGSTGELARAIVDSSDHVSSNRETSKLNRIQLRALENIGFLAEAMHKTGTVTFLKAEEALLNLRQCSPSFGEVPYSVTAGALAALLGHVHGIDFVDGLSQKHPIIALHPMGGGEPMEFQLILKRVMKAHRAEEEPVEEESPDEPEAAKEPELKTVLLVGGLFDDNGGKRSGVMDQIRTELGRVSCRIEEYNGGTIEDLRTAAAEAVSPHIDFVWWFASCENKLTKRLLQDLKRRKPSMILVTSKRNDNPTHYSTQDLLAHALGLHSNLLVEIRKVYPENVGRGILSFETLDPLGNLVQSRTATIPSLTFMLWQRCCQLSEFTRVQSHRTSADILPPSLWNAHDDFYDIIRYYAKQFSFLIRPSKFTERFLGASSFRCVAGFPSQRVGEGAFVSRRNVDKEAIGPESMVYAEQDEDGSVRYAGEHKPSVDTPIHLRLYEKFPWVNYIIHGHAYVEGATFTKHNVPCGALEEVDEIVAAVLESAWDDTNNMPFCINLVGHGCIILANTRDQLKGIPLRARDVPEILVR